MQPTDPILTDDSQTALWQALVRDAENRASRTLGDDLESYLVFTLMRHQRDAQLGGRTIAIEWLETLLANGRRREEGLRDVGDGCLLIAEPSCERRNEFLDRALVGPTVETLRQSNHLRPCPLQ